MIRRTDIVLVDLDPIRGSEASKRRPAVVMSNDGVNAAASRVGRGVVTVVPLTSRTHHVYPFQVLMPSMSTGLRLDSKAQAEQIRSVDVARLSEAVGRVPTDLMVQLDDAVRLHLGL